ncbi:MAG: phenylalanine--tRNA ligase beta subunit-related protein [Bacteroidales bacterium]
MKNIKISDRIREVSPEFKGLAISCRVCNSESDTGLWEELDAEMKAFNARYQMEAINKRLPIAANRKVYKALGKDPNRYRPSAEALCRRIVKEKSLYRINTLVDLINLVSIHTGYSIGGFDADKIEGDTLILGVGEAGEIFHGIGRGPLNIEGLPVYRDETGGIGTPTSDEERTKISLDTTRVLILINGYSGENGLEAAGEYMIDLLKKYGAAQLVETMLY